jgi:folate-dependent tRNA-U54 methylase TrmFO/GidA
MTEDEFNRFYDAVLEAEVAPVNFFGSSNPTGFIGPNSNVLRPRSAITSKGIQPSKYYLNCPMTEDEFNRFYDAVLEAEVAPVNSFEKEKYF